MHAFSAYWKERLGVAVNKAMAAVAKDDRKGKKEAPKPRKINGKNDIS